ncbi:hypothetical protein C8R47DRAFT_1066504 [Mycena vitilis]|nr:hypothetical protein C8R47DRAFT_1066504 [Mycena vitilis]
MSPLADIHLPPVFHPGPADLPLHPHLAISKDMGCPLAIQTGRNLESTLTAEVSVEVPDGGLKIWSAIAGANNLMFQGWHLHSGASYHSREHGMKLGPEWGSRWLCSIGFLTSSPIQGALLSSNLVWIRPAAFSGTRSRGTRNTRPVGPRLSENMGVPASARKGRK